MYAPHISWLHTPRLRLGVTTVEEVIMGAYPPRRCGRDGLLTQVETSYYYIGGGPLMWVVVLGGYIIDSTGWPAYRDDHNRQGVQKHVWTICTGTFVFVKIWLHPDINTPLDRGVSIDLGKGTST